jgi:small-conductance mechanosensitive channel
MTISWQWLIENWSEIVIPLVVFLAIVGVGFWLREFTYKYLQRWASRQKMGTFAEITTKTTKMPFLVIIIMLGVYGAIYSSFLDAGLKTIIGNSVGTVIVLIFAWAALGFIRKLLDSYSKEIEWLKKNFNVVNAVATAIVLAIATLTALELWGIPTTPVILVLGIALFASSLALSSQIRSFSSSAELARTGRIKIGDFVTLGTGATGYVTSIDWRDTRIRTLEGKLLLIPNTTLLNTSIINYGHQIKQAKSPFNFFTHLHIKVLTGRKAINLHELSQILKELPDSVVFYHTHHFLEEYNYLFQEPINDFAFWVTDVMGNEVLGERLASVDIFDFTSLAALKTRLAGIIDDYLSLNPDERKAPPGREFYFISSRSVVLPTPYKANNLIEFAEMLKKVTVFSIYFHVFEAHLRLQRTGNDFSNWVQDSLDEPDLAAEINKLSRYGYTLDALRQKIVETIEKYLGQK